MDNGLSRILSGWSCNSISSMPKRDLSEISSIATKVFGNSSKDSTLAMCYSLLSVTSGIRRSYLLEGIPATRPEALVAQCMGSVQAWYSNQTDSRGDKTGCIVLVTAGNTFAVNISRLQALKHALKSSLPASRGLERRGRPVFASAQSMAASGIPLVVCCAKSLEAPVLLTDEAWAEWRVGAHIAVENLVKLYAPSTSAPSSAGRAPSSSSAPVLRVNSAAFQSMCPVALAGLLLGYPCVYDTRAPEDISACARGMHCDPGPSGTVPELPPNAEWDESGRYGHCLAGAPLRVHTCNMVMAEGAGPRLAGHAFDRLDFSHPETVLPLGFLLESTLPSGARPGSAAEAACGHLRAGERPGVGAQPPSIAHSRVLIAAHIGAFKRDIETRLRTYSASLSLECKVTVRTETPDAVAL